MRDAIGDWHDQEQLISIAEKTLDHKPGCRLQAELKRTAQEKYDHALGLAEQLRKIYLRRSHPAGKGHSAASRGMRRSEVWEAISLLTV